MIISPLLLTPGLVLLLSADPSVPVRPLPPPGPPPTIVSQGQLDRSSVRFYVQLQAPAVRTCYVQELGRQPGLRAAVSVDFTVDASGRVVSCTPGTGPLDKCVAKVIRGVRFPEVYDLLSDGSSQLATGTTQVRYRFRFQPPQKTVTPAASRPVRRAASTAASQAAASQPASQPAAGHPVRPPRPPGTRVPPPPRPPIVPRPTTDDPIDGLQDGDPF
jgi:hypothetical protein